MIRVHCDGPDCLVDIPHDSVSLSHWVTVEGVDLRALEFCTLLCASRFMSTALAFMDDQRAWRTEGGKAWTEPELPLS